jgi:hypothetical protein
MQKAMLLNRSLVDLESRLQNVTKIVNKLQHEKGMLQYISSVTWLLIYTTYLEG